MSTPGFRVRNAQTGVTEIEISTRLSRSINETVIDGDGFINVPEFATGDGWVIYHDLTYTPYTQYSTVFVVKSANPAQAGILYQRRGIEGIPYRSVRIMYGVS